MVRSSRVALALLLALTLGCDRRAGRAPDSRGHAQPRPDAARRNHLPRPVRPATDPAKALVADPSPPSRLPSAGGSAVTHKYRVRLDSQCHMTMPDNTRRRIDSHVTFVYTWRWQGNEGELLLHSMEERTAVDGQVITASDMSRSRFRAQQGDTVLEETIDTAGPQLKHMLCDSFETPVCKVVREQTREGEKQVVTKREEGTLLGEGIVATALFFQKPFPKRRNRWEAPGELSMGAGGYARGILAYQLAEAETADAARPSHQVAVNVRGTLTGQRDPRAPGLHTVVYRLDGVQVFDTRLDQWVLGTLTVRMSCNAAPTGQQLPESGMIQLAMQRLPSDGVPAARMAQQGRPDRR